MGSEVLKKRRSGRLIDRWVSISTGFSPRHPANRDNDRLLDNISKYLSTINEADEQYSVPIHSDINLERFTSVEELPNMAEEARFNKIETDVSDMKSDIGSVNQKLDNLLETFARLDIQPRQQQGVVPPAPPNIHTPAQPQVTTNSNHNSVSSSSAYSSTNQQQQPGQQNAAHDDRLRSPHVHHMVGRQLTEDEFIQREMDRDRFQFAHNGRYMYTTDFNPTRVMAKPYMYLYREGVSSMKQKLDARQSLSLNEYIDGLLALLADKRAYNKDDYSDIMHHMSRVVRDALERPWHAVRRWTQFVWDSVESGVFSWADRDLIQEERVRLCMTAVYSNVKQITSDNTRHSQSTHVICRAYNKRMGCQHRESHGNAHVWESHACSYCDSIGKTCFHSVRECERRLAHARNDYTSQYNRNRQGHNAHNFQHQPQQNQVQQNYQQYSKNGQ